MFDSGTKDAGHSTVTDVIVGGLTDFATRTSLIDSVYLTLERTDDTERLEGMTLYWILPSVFVPRFIWPEKPDMHMGNLFGQRHGIIAIDDTATSISIGYIAELVWNFGAWGILLMLVLGGLNAAIYTVLVERGVPFRISIYSLVWLPMSFVGGEFAMYYGGIVRLVMVMIALWLIASIVARVLQSKPSVPITILNSRGR